MVSLGGGVVEGFGLVEVAAVVVEGVVIGGVLVAAVAVVVVVRDGALVVLVVIVLLVSVAMVEVVEATVVVDLNRTAQERVGERVYKERSFSNKTSFTFNH